MRTKGSYPIQLWLPLLLVVPTVVLSACSAGRALNQQAEKGYEVLKVGTDRDLFSSEEGSGGLKYLRAVGIHALPSGPNTHGPCRNSI